MLPRRYRCAASLHVQSKAWQLIPKVHSSLLLKVEADEVRCAICKKIEEAGEAVVGAAESIKDATVRAAKSVVDPGKEAVVGMMMSCFHLLFVAHNLHFVDPSKWNSSSSFLFFC